MSNKRHAHLVPYFSVLLFDDHTYSVCPSADRPPCHLVVFLVTVGQGVHVAVVEQGVIAVSPRELLWTGKQSTNGQKAFG